ncbi:MAG: AMP-binding protein [Planctomycetota bacterium]
MQTELKFRTLIDLFNESLAGIERLDKECLQIVRADRQELLTFEELRTRAREFAVWLVRPGGIRVGDRVAILGRNRVDWDVALWGTVLAGGLPVLIDPERPVGGVLNHVTHTKTRLIVMADDYQNEDSRQELREFASSSDMALIEMTVHEKLGLNEEEIDAQLSEIPGQIEPDLTAVILCTSGTTGDPREVELTHTNLGANLQGSVKKVDISAADVLGHILPPHHSFGLTVGKLLPFCVGAPAYQRTPGHDFCCGACVVYRSGKERGRTPCQRKGEEAVSQAARPPHAEKSRKRNREKAGLGQA